MQDDGERQVSVPTHLLVFSSETVAGVDQRHSIECGVQADANQTEHERQSVGPLAGTMEATLDKRRPQHADKQEGQNPVPTLRQGVRHQIDQHQPSHRDEYESVDEGVGRRSLPQHVEEQRTEKKNGDAQNQ